MSLSLPADNGDAASKTALLLEPYIHGHFVKWHLNDGTVLRVRGRQRHTLQQSNGEQRASVLHTDRIGSVRYVLTSAIQHANGVLTRC